MALIAIPQLYAVMAQTQPELLAAALAAHYPNAYMQIAPAQWLLVLGGTTAKEISDTLGVTAGQAGSVVIVTGTNYFGRSNPQIWEWLKSKLGSPNG